MNGQTAQARQSSKFYLIPGGTYSKRSKDFGVRVLPKEYLFAAKGPSITSASEETSPLFLIGVLNSRLLNILINLQANANQFDTGIIDKLPFADFTQSQVDEICLLVAEAVLRVRNYYSYFEPSTEFQKPALIFPIKKAWEWYYSEYEKLNSLISITNDRINSIVDSAYGVDSNTLLEIYWQSEEKGDEAFLEKPLRDFLTKPDEVQIAKDYFSFFIGLCFNRYQLDKLQSHNYLLSDPFENFQLSVNSAREAHEDNGGDMLFDEKKLLKNLKSLIVKLFDDKNYTNLCDILMVTEVDQYFTRSFFVDHYIKYTNSKREAPIYWPISTASGSYTIWIYYPKLNDQALYKIVSDFIIPKKEEVSEDVKKLELNSQLDNFGKKQLLELQDLLHELQVMEKELTEVAELPYKPNHDDGVLITAAPLHKFFRHSKWRKSTEDCWKTLQKGDYDWAHLAYSIWPDRVTKKCKKDLSMAIAHGLEDICEVKPKEKQAKKAAKPKKNASQGKLID